MTNETKPVAWRVKDYADGWTVHRYEHEAHRAARNGNLIEPLYTRAPINRPSPEAGESGKQPFERYPALASWIERLANTSMNLSLGDWMVFVGALNMTIERIEAELGEARKERDGEKAARRSLSMLAADEVDTANALRDLLFRARWYVNDALEAHEHSDGRDLLREIDAALPVQALASLSPAKDEDPTHD